MKITIKTTNLKLTSEIEDYINEKIGGIEKFEENLGSAAIARVEIGVINLHHHKGDIFRVEININAPGFAKIIRSVAERENVFVAIDEVKDELQREVKRYKGKMIAKQRRGAQILKQLNRLSPLSWFKGEFKKLRRKK